MVSDDNQPKPINDHPFNWKGYLQGVTPPSPARAPVSPAPPTPSDTSEGSKSYRIYQPCGRTIDMDGSFEGLLFMANGTTAVALMGVRQAESEPWVPCSMAIFSPLAVVAELMEDRPVKVCYHPRMRPDRLPCMYQRWLGEHAEWPRLLELAVEGGGCG